MIKPIKNKQQYEEHLERVYNLMQVDNKTSDETDELEILSIIVKQYEKEHYPIPPPEPIEAIKFRMEQSGMDEADLVRVLGKRVANPDVLSGKRKLTLSMIRKIHDYFHIPADILIRPY